ncbi:hypothetical protein H4683_003559 [Filibacter limicola]|uniref:Uncharacterized protein n=1 Tax=Sporosarcina limicola TaxID=34101 RepID=A0A927MS32_9BACL|nr:hypothetical protein [Sporosarcina limicola]
MVIVSRIDFLSAVLSCDFSKSRVLKGGMPMLKQYVGKVECVLGNWVVKAILLALSVVLCFPQP